MHRVTTARVAANVAAAGDTVLATVPAGRVWQLLVVVVSLRVKVTGAIGQVSFRDSGGFVRVRLSQTAGTAVPPVTIDMHRVQLAAGDQVVFNNANASSWGVLVSYFER